jgi:hypothetical protein
MTQLHEKNRQRLILARAGKNQRGRDRTMKDGFKCFARKRLSRYSRFGVEYRGGISFWENGRRLWGETSPVRRLSRGDALRDARQMASDAVVSSFVSRAISEDLSDDPALAGILAAPV